MSYRKKQQQMLQKRGPEDLNELDVKRSDIVHKVYRGGRVDVSISLLFDCKKIAIGLLMLSDVKASQLARQF